MKTEKYTPAQVLSNLREFLKQLPDAEADATAKGLPWVRAQIENILERGIEDDSDYLIASREATKDIRALMEDKP